MADMVKLTIDGKEVEVEKGTSVIQAAEMAGIAVPHYCYHPGLTVAGNCRMCLVEIEKIPKLVTSCTTIAGEGMVVQTGSGKVKEAVAGVEEFLLANHPLDCPICDQAGECRLQEYSFKHGKAESRFGEERLQFKKGVSVGNHVILDSERCIMCTRCVRFTDEITKTGELGVFQRGLHNEIGIFPGNELDNNYSGNVVDICPVGALTLKEFRFRKRVWFIRDIPTVCGTCAQGCNVNLGTNQSEIWRLTPRENPEVNGWWMCDEGRLSFMKLSEGERIFGAESRVAGEEAAHEPVPLQDAVARLANGLEKSAVIASGNLTLEDLWIIKRLVDERGSGATLLVPDRSHGSDDGFLIRADKSANRTGAAALGYDIDKDGASTKKLMERISSGNLSNLIVIGEDLATLPGGGAALKKLAAGSLIYIGPRRNATADAADLCIPSSAYGEFEGTWINFKGRAQRVRRGVTTRAGSLPCWQVFAMALKSGGVEVSHESAAQVLKEIASKVSDFTGLTWTKLGAGGIQLKLGEGADGTPSTPRGLSQPSWAIDGAANG
jgi:NADH-quinone oxidoreductase subunit G